MIPTQDQSKKGVIEIPWNEKAKGRNANSPGRATSSMMIPKARN